MFARESARGESYTAKATLTVTDPSGLLSSASLSNLANAAAQNIVSLNADASATAKADATTQSIDFTATGVNADDAIVAANAIAYEVAESIRETLAQQGDAYWDSVNEAASLGAELPEALVAAPTSADRVAALKSCVLAVTEATTAAGSGSSSAAKYAGVGLIGGLFVVICALAFVDAVRRPIKSRSDIAEVTDFPVLAEGVDSQSGERMWMNILFSAQGPLESVCVLPLSGCERDDVAAMLKSAIAASSSSRNDCDGKLEKNSKSTLPKAVVSSSPSLQTEASGVCLARQADATVVVVRAWENTTAELRDTLSELCLANARVAGILLTK